MTRYWEKKDRPFGVKLNMKEDDMEGVMKQDYVKQHL